MESMVYSPAFREKRSILLHTYTHCRGIALKHRTTRIGLLAAAAVGFAGASAAQNVTELDRASAVPSNFNAALEDRLLKFRPVGETDITIYGFARAEAFYDFDFAQGDLSRAGRVGDAAFETDGSFETSVRVSRFGIRSSTPSDVGTIGTQLEFDLFSGNDDTTSPTLRLRHANVTIGDSLLFGQFWTNFMPLVHYPRTADFNGPVGITFARVPQARYSFNSGDFGFSASIEESVFGSDEPALTAAGIVNGDNWSARIAGLVSRTENDSANGLTLSGSIQPWEGGAFSGTYVTGDGIAALTIGPGAVEDGGEAVNADGFTLEFRQQISDAWNVGIAYGNEDYDAGAVEEVESVHVNAFYSPVERLTVGLEYIHIENTTSGVTADADRIGASITFTF